MQTRRDQLQAYRFQNRRALAALVTGQPNVLEPPMRRLTVTTLSGIMIAILVALVFAVLAIIHPTAGDSWKDAGSVIVDQDDSSIYIYTHNTLHPVLNYTSAVLAVSKTNSVKRVEVSSGDLAGAAYGSEIGIPGVPSALPPADDLVSFPISACSQLTASRSSNLRFTPRVTLRVDTAAGRGTVPSDQGVLVTLPGTGQPDFLLYRGEQLRVGSPQIAASLGYSDPIFVGPAFLNSVPTGPALQPPDLSTQAGPASYRLTTGVPQVGTILRTPGPRYFLALKDGTVPLTPLELTLYDGARTVPASLTSVTRHTLLSPAAQDPQQNPLLPLRLLPPTAPKIDAGAAGSTGACAVYRKGAATPQLALIGHASTSIGPATTTRPSSLSKIGEADKVDVPATEGMLATPENDPHTALMISAQGLKYSFANADLLAAFGYTTADIVRVPPQLLALIPRGTGLSRSAALRPVQP